MVVAQGLAILTLLTALAEGQAPHKLAPRCKPDELILMGLSCTQEDPCPVFLELNDVHSVGIKLFVSGSLHTANITLESILLASEDGGKTWTEPAERIGSAGFDNIQFFDFETGWLSGQIQLSQPRDPFFLLTTDGGKTWRRRPVSGEARLGAVEHFYFDSRTTGKMIIDKVQLDENGMRYEQYETMTGGESWSIRQVSPKPIPWKEPVTGDKEWRLRADAPSKTYKLERNQAGKWLAATSFSVSAGECKVVDAPEPEPPPTDESAAKPNAPASDPGVFVVHSPPSTNKKKKKN